MHRIFFDTNEGSQEFGYLLHLPSSAQDLATMGSEVREGARVTICMPNELEMEATLTFDSECGCWKAMPIPGTIKYLDGS
ncbi:MAG TPA: hypothetical protein VHU87_15590 [Rhizomicrobium sp.]|jgi:hypothetical protein|nr:hypothetical protein [Rhizomicrobium sp.]